MDADPDRCDGNAGGAGSFWTRLANGLVSRRFPILLLLFAFVGGLGFGVPKIKLETHAERFLSPGHEARNRYDEFKLDFGLDTPILLMLETKDVFAPDFLRSLAELHERLEVEVPWTVEVDSLADARWLESDGDTLRIRDLIDPLPTTAIQSRVLAERVETNRAYRDYLVSNDHRITTVTVRLDAFPSQTPSHDGEGAPLTASQSREAVRAVRQVATQWAPPGVVFHLAGNPTINEQLAQSIQTDMGRFVSWAILAMGISLALLFQRLSAVLLPIGTSLIAIIAVLGAAGWWGQPLNVASQILPPLLLAVGVSASIHLLSFFYRDFDERGDRRLAIRHALQHAGPATLITGLTTAAGLASFAAASDMAPVHQLGVLAPIGVLLTLVLTLVGLPASLAALPTRRRPARSPGNLATRLGNFLGCVGVWTLRRPRRVLFGVGTLAVASLFAAAGIEADNDALAYFPVGHPIRTSTEIFDRSLAGSINLELIVDTGRPGGLYDPELMEAFDSFSRAALDLPSGGEARIRKVLSVVDILRETHETLDGDSIDFRPLPDDSRLIAQELLLFESTGAEGLERFVLSDYSKGRITLRGPWVPSKDYARLVPALERALLERLPEGVSVETTGLIVLFAEAVKATSRAFIESYGTAMLLIAILMVVFVGNLRGGLASMIPNVLPIALTLGLMGSLGLDLDLFTLLIGSIAIGLAVDDTIHLIDAFRRFYRETGDFETAIRRGLETTGAAILTSSIALCLGFAGFMLSSMTNLALFGALTVVCIALAFAIDVLVLPALTPWILAGASEATSKSPLEDPPVPFSVDGERLSP